MSDLVEPLLALGDVEVVTIHDSLQSNPASIFAFLEDFGWDVPVGVDSRALGIFSMYGEIRDTFIVIDKEGIVQFRKGYGGNNAGTFQLVRATIEQLVPVKEQTWGGIKRLYR